MPQIPKEIVEHAYGEEKDPATKLRILLVLNTKYGDKGQNQAARELHLTSGWASKWIWRFEKYGLEGLKTKQRSGRPPKLSHQKLVKVKRKVVRNEVGWSVKEVRELIRKDAKVTYTERHVYRLMQKWGVRAIVPDKRVVHKASMKERLAFKKTQPDSSEISQEASPWYLKTNLSSYRTLT